MVNASKFTSDHIEQLFVEDKCVSSIKVPCTTQNKIQKLESDLLKPYPKKLPFFAYTVNGVWCQASVTPIKVLLVGNSGTT